MILDLENKIKKLRTERDAIDLGIAELTSQLEAIKRDVSEKAGQIALPDADLSTGYETGAQTAQNGQSGYLLHEESDKCELDTQYGYRDGQACAIEWESNPAPTVTKSSSIEDKYKLFMSLFAGRSDVHAKRWQSAKTGKSGYSPACDNTFIRKYCCKGNSNIPKVTCMVCEHQSFPPITMETFTEHIKGKDGSCKDVLGAYPLDTDGMCKFVAVDFDDENREAGEDAAVLKGFDPKYVLNNAASAFYKTCLAQSVPAYMERSRSGEGMHVWVFFSDKVSAKKARKLCGLILTKAMNEYPDVRFNSYDRLVPGQDILPEKGFGSLIALPLQGRAGKNKNSLFVDENLNHYPDQWAFLSSIRKMDEVGLDTALARLAGMNELGDLNRNEDEDVAEKPWERKKPEEKLSSADATGEVEIVYANMIHVGKANLSVRAINHIRRLGAFSNPIFYKTQAMNLSVRKIPRIISTSEDSDEYVSIPRGTEDALRKLLDEAGIAYHFDDKTTKGKPVKVSFTGELRDEQPAAADALISHDIGVLSATPAFGKTVISEYMIAKKKVNALVLVSRQQLLGQWKESLTKFLKIDEDPPVAFTPTGRRKKTSVIGEYSGGRKKLSGIIDVATIQSLHREGEVKDFVKDYGLVIVDECHHVPAFSFEAVLKQINAKYIYGLTATPSREDGLHAITTLECGPIRYRVDAKAQAEKRPFDHFVVPRFTNFLKVAAHDESNYAALLNDLMNDEHRNRLLIEDIAGAINDGRNPLVLTERVEHVEVLTELLSAHCENVITLMGGMNTIKMREIYDRLRNLEDGEKFVIVATGKYVGEGFDFPRLDTLFLALPIKSKTTVTQYIGRLQRLVENKADVMVYDYVDVNIPMLERMYYTRIRHYKAAGYKTLTREKDSAGLNIIFDSDEYMESLIPDIESAKKEIVLASPFLTERKVTEALPALTEKLISDVIVTILTKPLDEYSGKYRTATERNIDRLKTAGMKVVTEPELHQKFVIIDRHIVWYGSVNPLGHSKKEDSIMRFDGADVAAALLSQRFGSSVRQGEPESDSAQMALFE